VANATGYIGPGGPTVTENNGRLFIQLKPHSQRDISADEVIRHLDAKLQSIQGIRAYLQAAQDINIGARLLKTQYQYTLTDVDQDELNAWASKLFKAVQTLPELSDVATDQAITGRQLNLELTGIRGAAGNRSRNGRQYALRRFWSAARRSDLHDAQLLLRYNGS
jgi:multidrug efflux pump subunit AcrB